jgi:hypothetical protein
LAPLKAPVTCMGARVGVSSSFLQAVARVRAASAARNKDFIIN